MKEWKWPVGTVLLVLEGTWLSGGSARQKFFLATNGGFPGGRVGGNSS